MVAVAAPQATEEVKEDIEGKGAGYGRIGRGRSKRCWWRCLTRVRRGWVGASKGVGAE